MTIETPAVGDLPVRMGLSRRIRRFAQSRSGLSAVEFALILPVMVGLFFGGTELSDGLTISRKVTHITSSLSDLITQSKTITDADMANILDAAASVITPYSNSLLKIKVTQVKIDANSVATVSWSDAQNDTALTPGSPISIPAALRTPSSYLITAEVHYAYTPTVGYILTGTYDLTDKFYLRPRLSDSITRTAS